MGIALRPQIFFGKVMHKRLTPKVNVFSYGMYYLALPLSQRHVWAQHLAVNSFAPLSFYDRDHGLRDGSDLQHFVRDILQEHQLQASGEIVLVCMPRVFGYVFNPVSFYLCHDGGGALKAVICQVHNTFGEAHLYVCAHADGRTITRDDEMTGEKVFHVSPFFERKGRYRFRFDIQDHGAFGVWIDYDDGDGKGLLLTSLIGRCDDLNRAQLRKAFWRYPLITFKAIALIHWQALKLVFKGMKYISKPKQRLEKTSTADNLTKV